MWILMAMVIAILPAAVLFWTVVFEKDNDKLKSAARAYKTKNPISGPLGYTLVYGKVAFNKTNRKISIPLIGIIIVGILALLVSTWNKMCWVWFLVLLGIEVLSVVFLIRWFKNKNK